MTNWTPVEPLSDEPQDHAYWQPWEPKIGDRVRVRLNGECRVEGPSTSLDSGKRYLRRGHPEWENGATGSVVECAAYKCVGFSGHEIVVAFTAPGGQPWMAHFAACELEKLDP